MRIYAERTGRAARQVLADVLMVGWVVLVVEIARTAWALVARLQGLGQSMRGAGEAIRGAFEDAAQSAATVPLAGDGLARAFGTGASAGESLASSGQAFSDIISTLAFGTAAVLVLIGALPLVLVWLTLRVRWMVAARSALAARAVDTDLLALRALTRQPVQRLLRVCPDPAAAWRRDDRAALHQLAALELHKLGLRAPGPTPN